MFGVVQRLTDQLAHQARGARHAVKARKGAHLEDGGYAPSRLPKEAPVGRAKLDFRRGVGAISQFVLETLDQYRVLLAIRRKARHEKTRQALFGLRQHQVGIALRG
jgi:hypothetical protein